MNKFIEILYGVLIEPIKTFQNINEQKNYKFSLLIIAFISLFLLLLANETLQFGLFFTYISNFINLIIHWILWGFFIDLMSKIYTCKSKYSKLLTLLSLTFVPLIFIAPIKLLKNSFEIFDGIGNLFLLFIWFWIIILQVFAIAETYSIPRKNAILILFIPFLGTILYFFFVVEFFTKMAQFVSL